MSSSILDKIPPQSLEAEQACLGAMLLEREALIVAADTLRAEDFYRESHRTLFQGMVDLLYHREPVDLITLGEWLQARDMLATIGGTLYLTTIMSQVPTAAGIAHYCKIVRAKAVQRALIHAADEIMATAYDPGEQDLPELQAACEKKLHDIGDLVSQQAINCEEARIGKLMAKEFYRFDEEQTADPSPGVLSDINTLNTFIDPGLQPGEVLVLAGLTSMGKSVLAVQNFGIAAAKDTHYTVVYLGCEMEQLAIARRSMAANSQNTALWHMKNLAYRRNNFESITDKYRDSKTEYPIAVDLAQTVEKGWNWPFFCFYEPGLTPNRIRTICRRVRREHGLGLLIIDGLWLMESDVHYRNDNEYQQVTRNMKAVKTIAGEFRIPIILVHQLNRYMNNKDKGVDYLPQVSDLRSSGEIEQSADYVLFVHRPRHLGDERYSESDTMLLMRKNRTGPTGETMATFEGDRSRFVNKE